jgi:hypothetical protein
VPTPPTYPHTHTNNTTHTATHTATNQHHPHGHPKHSQQGTLLTRWQSQRGQGRAESPFGSQTETRMELVAQTPRPPGQVKRGLCAWVDLHVAWVGGWVRVSKRVCDFVGWLVCEWVGGRARRQTHTHTHTHTPSQDRDWRGVQSCVPWPSRRRLLPGRSETGIDRTRTCTLHPCPGSCPGCFESPGSAWASKGGVITVSHGIPKADW